MEFSLSQPPQKEFDFVGGGSSGVITFLPPNRVLKLAHQSCPQDVEHERKIFEALGPHPRIVRHFGKWKDINRSAVFEYHPRGCVRKVLLGKDTINRHKWTIQIVEGLVFVHSKGYTHGDLNASNLLVTDNDDIVLCDFAGSSLNGERPGVLCIDARHFRPRERGEEEDIRSVVDDLFALGSVLYELYTHHKPYVDKKDDEVEKLYRQGTFPDVTGIPLGDVITKCWMGKYKTAAEVLADLQSASTSVTLYSQFLNLVLYLLAPFRWSLSLKWPWFSRSARP